MITAELGACIEQYNF